MLIANKYEVPDYCPNNCRFTDEIYEFGQNAMCIRCPVFNCSKDKDGFSLLDPQNFREDWAESWYNFFKDGLYPRLQIMAPKDLNK